MKNTYLRGELYYADLGTGIGSEQNGYRPVVIIQNDVGNKHSPTTIVAAISTQIRTKANLPTHYHLKPWRGHGDWMGKSDSFLCYAALYHGKGSQNRCGKR